MDVTVTPAQEAKRPNEFTLYSCSKCKRQFACQTDAPNHPACPYRPCFFEVTSLRQARSNLKGLSHGAKATKAHQQAACEFLWRNPKLQEGEQASLYVAKGSYKVGFEGGDARTVFITEYQLTPDQLKELAAAHPGVWFIPGTEHHDHPMAHISNQLATRALLRRIKGKATLDLHGNPAANRKNNMHGHDIDTMVERVTPKDFIRAATKWGDWELDANVFEAQLRDVSTHPRPELMTRLREYETFLSVHTLYYYERREIAALLSHREGSVLHAIVHKHEGQSGSMFCGEMDWKREAGTFGDRIRQTNRLTHETYEHPALDWLFSGACSWANDTLGFGWTLSKIGPDTYLATFTSAPIRACLCDPLADKGKQNSTPPPSTTVELTVPVDDTPTIFTGVAPKAAAQMRLHVSGKARTSEQYKDHLAATKRAMKKHDELGEGFSPCQTAMYSFLVELESDKAVSELLPDLCAIREDLGRSLKHGSAVDELSILTKMCVVAAAVSPNKTVSTLFRMGGNLAHSHGDRLD